MIYDMGNMPAGDKMSVERGENCIIYHLSNSSGTGRITQYDVYDSVNVLYDDMHLTRFGEGSYGENFLMIEHCREGRFEAQFMSMPESTTRWSAHPCPSATTTA